MQLNDSGSGTISQSELKTAINAVAASNSILIDSVKTNALVQKVMMSDTQMTRSQLRLALENNEIEISHLIKENKLPQTTPAISEIMKVIESSKSGLITSTILHAAIKQAAVNNQVVIDTEVQNSFVAQVFAKADFEQKGSISRNVLEHAMASQNVETFKMFEEKVLVTENSPAILKVMNELNSLDKGTVSVKDLKRAIKIVSKESGKESDIVASNAFVEKVFLSMDAEHKGEISRA